MFADAIELDLTPVEGRDFVNEHVVNKPVDQNVCGNKRFGGKGGQRRRVHRQSPVKGFSLCDIYNIYHNRGEVKEEKIGQSRVLGKNHGSVIGR